MMCPQLFINYKLKSVAHLPWRQMTYKFLNTIVDDLFAFVIKMPTLHRLSVFRDGERGKGRGGEETVGDKTGQGDDGMLLGVSPQVEGKSR